MDTNLPSPKLSGPKRTAIITNTFSALVAVGAVVLAVGAMSGVAQAQTRNPVTQVTANVSYADLDLSTQDGANTLLKRIKSAAKEACGPDPVMSPLTPLALTRHERCLTEAADKAVADVNSPLLVALYTGAPLNTEKLPVTEQFAAR